MKNILYPNVVHYVEHTSKYCWIKFMFGDEKQTITEFKERIQAVLPEKFYIENFEIRDCLANNEIFWSKELENHVDRWSADSFYNLNEEKYFSYVKPGKVYYLLLYSRNENTK